MLKKPICIPLTSFSKSWKKFFGKFLFIQNVLAFWNCAFSMTKYRYSGKFLSKKIGLETFGLCTFILEREEGRVEKLTKIVFKLNVIHKNWERFKTWNAYEINYSQCSSKWDINGFFKLTMLRALHIFKKVCFFRAPKMTSFW